MSLIESDDSYGYKNLNIQYGMQTVFSTIPFQTNENDDAEKTDNDNKTQFEIDIEKFYFEEFRENLKFKDKNSKSKDNIDYNLLYKPLKFFMLGDYDVLYVTLINNFKFSHRLFEPITQKDIESKNKDLVYNAHTFQSYSGFVLNQNKKQIHNIFKSVNDNDKDKVKPISYFVGVINLKLNNGLFIGNGLNYIDEVYKHIEKKLEELKVKNYLINQTFSWFELSIMIFIDKPEILTDTLLHLRAMVLGDLNNNQIAQNSLYSKLLNSDDELEKINKTSLFADTNSHFGFNERLIRKTFKKNDEDFQFDDYVDKFYKRAQSLKLKTEIEWQVKPGHIIDLINLLKDNNYLKNYFFDNKLKNITKSNTNMVLGKCDYYLSENKSNSILSNFHLIRYIARKSDVFKHARKVRTYIFLDKLDYLESNYKQRTDSNQNSIKNIVNWSDILKKLAIKNIEFYTYDNYLKKLKVSRHIRNKILKIFSNFNNGILDPIQFTYFVDFSILIEKLKLFIKYEAQINDNETKSVTEITDKLIVFINTFQEAYNVRFLNGYQFENISDFDLDYNNSIQQLLSSYGILVNQFGKHFYDLNSLYGPVIQLNDLDTVSDIYTINYAIHHFTSPEFIFTTLSKEVLNSLLQENEFQSIKLSYDDIILSIKRGINESYFDDLIISGTFDLNYFIIDCIRYYVTFNENFNLYQHWIWTYNFQNTSLYDTDGMFNENHLKTEMLRLLMLQKFVQFANDDDFGLIIEENSSISKKLECPLPHLEAYWFLHFEKLNEITNLIFQNHFNEFNEIIHFINEKRDSFGKSQREMLTLKNLNSKIINKTLLKHYEMNKGKTVMVNRDWSTGKFCKNIYDQDVLYAIDQIGTQYFFTNKGTQEYFEFNSKIILSVLDYATKHKKDFISEIISMKDEADK